MFKFFQICNPKRSFSLKLLGYIIFLVSIVIFSVAYYSFQQVRQIYSNIFYQKGTSIAQNLAFSSELGVLSGNKEFLDKPFGSLLQFQDIVYLAVYTIEGTPIRIENNSENMSSDLIVLDYKIREEASKNKIFVRSEESKGISDFVAPVYTKSLMSGFEEDEEFNSENTPKEVIGFTRVVISHELMETEQANIISNFLWIFIVIFILATITAILFSRIVTKSLAQLSEGATKIQKGELDYKIPINSCDEIGQLAEQFNLMTGSLKNTISEKDSFANELKELNVNLESKVQERTREMQEANKKLNDAVRSIADKNVNLLKVQEELEAKNNKIEQVLVNLQNAQVQLVQAEKMSALGKLVAGIAHEINTPMGAINSNTDIASKSIAKINALVEEVNGSIEDPIQKKLKKFLSILTDSNKVSTTACERIVSLIKNLKNFARLDQAELQKVNLIDGIESTLTLVYHETKNKVQFEKDYQEIPLIECHPNQLNQVFMNIIVNSTQAIEGKGVIKIKTYEKDNFVFIELEDSGKGIKPENLSRIFDPGFTTKGVGVGTGLGLSICHNIIKNHKGDISVQSEVGKGSKFIVKLPIKSTLVEV
ncbi:MAG: HAMP domain-containing protein [Calditrichaeota bacterium]|nr:MAG: HAMP domain-containing protein [Calditrichota bacterium]